ncbi:hypothetical protein V6N11_045967 [Hibiscus sabdariffa]|uniref:Uncharacterized protein n=1 Tax=Hibiscus sabdariffa TaxID=183260 RepID=A0ABR2Q2H8_9ROSI
MNMFLKSEIVKLDGKDRVGDFQPSSILEAKRLVPFDVYKRVTSSICSEMNLSQPPLIRTNQDNSPRQRIIGLSRGFNRLAYMPQPLHSSVQPLQPKGLHRHGLTEELVDIVDDDDDCNDGLRTDKQDNASEKDVGSVAEALRDQVDTEGKEQSSSSNSSSGSDSSGSGSSSSDSESKSSDGDSAISI